MTRAVRRSAHVLFVLAALLIVTVPALAQSATPTPEPASNPILTPAFSAFVQQILLLTLPALAAAAVGYLIKALTSAYTDFKAQQPGLTYTLENAVAMAVKAAEQTGLKNEWMQQGQAKYDLAFELATKYLDSVGLHVDGKLLAGAIEAAVLELFPKDPPASTPSA